MMVDKPDMNASDAMDNNVVSLPSPEDIEAEAASWLIVLGREQVSEADRAAFHRWFHSSERHRSVFNDLSALWDDLKVLEELNDIAAAPAALPVERPFPNRRSVLAAAASIIAAIGAGALFYSKRMVQDLDQSGVFQTAVGQQLTVKLSDGSVLQLNTASRAEVSFSQAERIVRLTAGEAHFDVAKDKRRPFSVHAPGGIVKAVGTAFVVRTRPDDTVEVTVEEGHVLLSAPEKPQQSHAARSAQPIVPPPLAELTPGQSAIFSEKIEEIAQIPEPKLKRKLAWRQGMLAYSGESLAEVISDISRYTDIEIEIADPALADRLVAGYFRVGEVEALFETLRLNFDIDVNRIDSKHVRLTDAS